jgi:CheY-like chemotaxis protein
MLLTSSAKRGDCELARSSGFDAFLVKPAPPDMLRGVLHTMRAMAGNQTQIITRYMIAPPVVTQNVLATTPGPIPLTGAAHRILLAEDNAINQRVAVLMLKRLGCRVDVAGNGLEAVEFAARFPYDIIFLDCNMPELDGFGAARAIRATERGGTRVPLIALTASVLEEDRERCRAAGMDDFLTKPVLAEHLSNAIQRFTTQPKAAVNQ